MKNKELLYNKELNSRIKESNLGQSIPDNENMKFLLIIPHGDTSIPCFLAHAALHYETTKTTRLIQKWKSNNRWLVWGPLLF